MTIGINAYFLTKPYTGIGKYTYHLLKSLSKIDKNNRYYYAVPEKISIKFGDNFSPVIIPFKKYLPKSFQKFVFEQMSLPLFFQRKKVDIVHYLYPSVPSFFRHKRSVVTVHDCIPWDFSSYRKGILSKLYHRLMRVNIRKAERLIAVSHSVKDELRYKYHFQNPIDVIYEAKGLANEQKSLSNSIMFLKKKFGLERSYILYVGGYDERKNVKKLLDGYVLSRLQYEGVDLVLAGNKAHDSKLYKSYDYLRDKDPLKYFVHRIGFVNDSDLALLYRHTSAFAHLSLSEGFNIPLIEANSFNIPILASDIPVHREVLKDSALFINPLNVNAIAEGLKRIIYDNKLRSVLLRKSAIIRRKYSWEKTARETLMVYKKAVDNSKFKIKNQNDNSKLINFEF